jgi:hypothetical protein
VLTLFLKRIRAKPILQATVSIHLTYLLPMLKKEGNWVSLTIREEEMAVADFWVVAHRAEIGHILLRLRGQGQLGGGNFSAGLIHFTGDYCNHYMQLTRDP